MGLESEKKVDCKNMNKQGEKKTLILKKSPQSLMQTRRQRDKPSRYIPAPIRRILFQRSKGRCEFISENGTRCNSRHQVQIDHIKPFSLGGSNELDNLQSCCRLHNSYLATLAGIGIETTSTYKNYAIKKNDHVD